MERMNVLARLLPLKALLLTRTLVPSQMEIRRLNPGHRTHPHVNIKYHEGTAHRLFQVVTIKWRCYYSVDSYAVNSLYIPFF